MLLKFYIYSQWFCIPSNKNQSKLWSILLEWAVTSCSCYVSRTSLQTMQQMPDSYVLSKWEPCMKVIQVAICRSESTTVLDGMTGWNFTHYKPHFECKKELCQNVTDFFKIFRQLQWLIVVGFLNIMRFAFMSALIQYDFSKGMFTDTGQNTTNSSYSEDLLNRETALLCFADSFSSPSSREWTDEKLLDCTQQI